MCLILNKRAKTESPLSFLTDTHDVLCKLYKAMSFHNTNGKCHVQKLESYTVCLIVYFKLINIISSFNSLRNGHTAHIIHIGKYCLHRQK